MTKRGNKQPVKEFYFTLTCFLACNSWHQMSMYNKWYLVQFLHKVVKAFFDPKLLENLPCILWGNFHNFFEGVNSIIAKVFETRFWAIFENYKQNFTYFWFANNLLYRMLFYFAVMLNQSQFIIPQIERWGHHVKILRKTSLIKTY